MRSYLICFCANNNYKKLTKKGRKKDISKPSKHLYNRNK
ncbi:hypothetical protein J2W95_002383 [Flavobacterium granuli]|uniref:Uncharacterized protein n=1 Tax=Flavobacterium granuli TaxID=280093 RepID=A0ABU1S3T0_9FLAO|nr:hypothetical protein [Flavobacterium granuli]